MHEVRGLGYSGSVKMQSLSLVAEEILRAREKFPDPSGLMVALMEEVGELAAAMLQEHGDHTSDRVRREAVQVACVALRILEEGDPAVASLPASCAKP